jgi:hypothetical protein
MEVNSEYKLKTANYIRVISDKRQILLGNTHHYNLNHVKHAINRNNGTYDKLPHFTITKDGKIYQHFDVKFYSNYLSGEYTKDVISIGLENIGQIFEEKGIYTDIYNNIYEGTPFEKNWKNCSIWDPYTETQFESCIYLCNKLIDENQISRAVMPANVFKQDIANFKGICYKSNYDSKYYDLNPNWDFEKFKEKIEKNG